MSILNQIQSLEFQLEIPSRGHNRDIQDKVVSLFNHRLQAMLDNVLSSFSETGSDIGFERIELSLDPISLDIFEEDLLQKTEVSLKDYLGKAFEKLQYTKAPKAAVTGITANTTHPYSVTQTATLAHFLTHGYYPWWDKELDQTLSQRWIAALQQEKRQFTTQLFLLGKKSYVIKRMSHQLPDKTLRHTISIVEPGGAKSIFSFHDHLKEKHLEKPISSGLTANDFSRAIWMFTLSYLFMEMGSAFHQKMFLKSQVKQIAQHYNTTYQTVLIFLNKGLQQIAEHDIKRRSLFLTLKELGKELVDEKKPPHVNPFEDDLLVSLKKLLKKTSYTKKDRSLFARHIATLQKREKDRKTLSHKLTSKEFYNLVAYIIPQEKDFINEYLLKTAHSYKENPVSGSSRDGFMNSIRELVLSYLLIENTTIFNRKMFLKNQIARIAQHYNMSNEDALKFLAYGFQDIEVMNQVKATLFGILKLLLEESLGFSAETMTIPQAEDGYDPSPDLLKALASLQVLSVKERKLLISVLEQLRKSDDSSYIKALTESDLFNVLRHLIPDQKIFVKHYATHMTSLHAKVFSKPSSRAFSRRVWSFIIADLLSNSSQFNTKAFTDRQLKQLSSHFTVEYIAILFHFMEDLDTVSGDRNLASLKDTLATLYLEHHVNPAVFRKIAKKTDFSAFIPQIIHFLRFGSYASDDPYISKSVLAAVFLELLLNYQEKLFSALQSYNLADADAKNGTLPGLAFFPEHVISAWKQFKKEYVTVSHIKADHTLMITDGTVKKDPEGAVTHAQYENILSFYLKTGSLPWWAGALTLESIVAYLLDRPKAFLTFIPSQQWTASTVQRMYKIVNAGQRRRFLHIVAGETRLQTGAGINNVLKHISRSIDADTLQQVFLLFALQHIKQDLSTEAFARLYLKQLTGTYHLNYDTLIIKAEAYTKTVRDHAARSFFEKEKAGITPPGRSPVPEKILQLYREKKPSGIQLESLSEFIKKEDKSTVAQLLGKLLSRGKKTPEAPVFKIFLQHLHKKDHAVTSFFTDVAQLAKTALIRKAFPSLYEDILRFYIDYISIKKIAAFDFNEFIMRWFAHMEKKNRDKTIKLMHLLKQHRKKQSLWIDTFIIYTSERLPATKGKTGKKQAAPPQKTLNKRETNTFDAPLTEKVLVFNAGLVLLWPFLNHCFKTLQYLDNNEFKDQKAQERAIYLLHYAATGSEEEPGEEHLIINKLLCGFPLTQPMDTAMALNTEEKNTVESMLNAVIARWSKLGNTSIDGLRGSYIIREGYLEEVEKAYQLQIEKKGFDILLDYLPWGLGMVKLPWINKILYVSWRSK